MTVADRFAGVGLEPEAAQQVFRAVLNSFSRPGLPHRLPSTGFPPALLPALALADLETGVAVLDGADAEWGEILTVATGATEVSADSARFVTVLRSATPGDLGNAARGTALSPESAATVVCAVPSLTGGTTVTLEGPGVRETGVIAPRGFDENLWRARNEAVSAFPAGIDVLLVADDGTMLGLPRTTGVLIERES
ncbi:phosphonate C-P lyase system protein PhnH [Rhodococcus zopfii]|uniref:phosphonate C-P lyase system protein PhnH n=1 Tax=Rhodococcus zopfii TaxID=43772 RepID=UPI0035287927